MLLREWEYKINSHNIHEQRDHHHLSSFPNLGFIPAMGLRQNITKPCAIILFVTFSINELAKYPLTYAQYAANNTSKCLNQ